MKNSRLFSHLVSSIVAYHAVSGDVAAMLSFVGMTDVKELLSLQHNRGISHDLGRRTLHGCNHHFETFSNRTLFNSAVPDFVVEDFEGSNVGPFEVIDCGTEPLGSSNSCFSLGELLPGFAVVASSEQTVVVGPGIVPNNPTSWVGANLFTDTTFVEFYNSPLAVGLDVVDFSGSSHINIQVFDSKGPVCSENVMSGDFFGVIAKEAISSMQLGDWHNIVLLDNLVFGKLDSDGDGIYDIKDVCPQSMGVGGTVQINDCDSGVANFVSNSGCTISDLIDRCPDFPKRTEAFFSCVLELTANLKQQGAITGAQRRAIRNCTPRPRSVRRY